MDEKSFLYRERDKKSGGHTPSANATALAGTPEANSRNSTTDRVSQKPEFVNSKLSGDVIKGISDILKKSTLMKCCFIAQQIKMTEVSGQGNTQKGVTQNSRSVNISISDIFEKVNPFEKF